jgi:uncharacterized protein YecT (DUF1311 family)
MVFAIVLAAAAAGPCDAAQTQLQLTECWSARAKQAQTSLAAARARVTAGLRALGIDPDPLAAIARAWTAARDKTCAFEEALYTGGSIAPMIGAECVDGLTRARIARLNGLLAAARTNRALPPRKPPSAPVQSELDRFYRSYVARVTPSQRTLLTSAQTAWIAYRDEACAFEGGDCATELERQRTADLKASWIGDPF